MSVRRLARTAAWLTAGAALGASGVAGYTAWSLNGRRTPRPMYAFTPFEVGADAEDVTFTASDGVRLAGWWMETPGSETVVVVAHGYRGNKSDMLGIGPGLWRAGHTVLLFDFRGLGESDHGPQSLAHYEQRDLRAAIDLAAERRPDARIVVVGFSMGASVAVLVAADDPRVEVLVLDSPFATLREVVGANYARYRLPERLLGLADAATRRRYGYSFSEVRPVDRIGALASRPMLLMHCTGDELIPYSHGLQMASAAGPDALFVTFEGLYHCGGYFADRPGYIARVDEFIRRSLERLRESRQAAQA